MEAPEVKQFESATVISMEHTGSYNDIGDVYHELYAWAKDHGVKTTGHGLTIFLAPPNELDSHSAVYEVCIPVDSAPEPDSKVSVKQLPATTVASVTVHGDYSEIPSRYTEMLAWLSVEGMTPSGPPREVYIKRPGSGGKGDPSEFVTEIQFPIDQ